MTNAASGTGTRAFFTVWFGQLISLIGSQLTGFALGVWVYQQTGSVFWLAVTQVAKQAPYVLLSPLAGVLADRWNRRTAMIVSDFGANRGIGLLISILGILSATVKVVVLASKAIRNVESDLPDHIAASTLGTLEARTEPGA